jgi:hypothetical protein
MATVKRALTGVDVVTQSLGVSAGPEIITTMGRLFNYPQSSSASRFTAGAAGFLLLIQCRERPET